LERALVIDLEHYRDNLRAYHDTTLRSEHVNTLVAHLLSSRLPEYRLTRSGNYGVPVPLAGFEGHVIDVWTELMFSQLSLEASQSSGHGEIDEGSAEHVQFFGFDNTFFYAVLFPVLSFALEDQRLRPSALISNEFMLLDNAKFSTSRGHAIWAGDALAEVNSDVLRFAMLSYSPDDGVRSLSTASWRAIQDGHLIAPIAEWLDGLADTAAAVGSVAPATGAWSRVDRYFYESLNETLKYFSESLSLERFSTAEYVKCISDLVERASRLSARVRHMNDVAAQSEELRTGYALELLAAKVFSIVAYPAMPKPATRLHSELGLPGDLPRWQAQASFLKAGTSLSFSGEEYFPAPYRTGDCDA
jgi:methionyl-tRNA synthetase